MPAPVGRRPPLACSWLGELACSYLPRFRKSSERRAQRWGYRFQRTLGRNRTGFFVGFLSRPPGWAFGPFAPPCRPPECVVYAFVEPAGGRLHQALVRRRGSLFRSSYDLLTKYTARPPRWEFYEDQGASLARRFSLADFPRGQRDKHALNFFMESLALLLRSSLPDSLSRCSARRR